MVSRRSRALLDLVVSLLALVGLIAAERAAARADRSETGRLESAPSLSGAGEDRDTASGSGVAVGNTRLSARWVVVGAAAAVCYRALYDRDVWSIRRSWLRRALVGGALSVGGVAFGLSDREASFSYTLGSSAATILYRLKYGLLDAPPE
ncbi:hypothetical protein [Natrononativus amylolyticus]|uniref:hypothetical protein n=1 Tax=Natrononativus amylolyticus TaxID=2963434 RepID=UPI0020CCBA58|nr:hypothetical protein [Natrononativus amylolyticus]